MKTRKFRDGEVVYREGDTSDSAYIVQSGRVDLFKDGATGPILVATAGPGELFGETGLLDGRPRDATAYCAGDVSVKMMARREFLRRIENDPATAMTVMAKLAQRLRQTDERAAMGDSWQSGLPVPVDAVSSGGGLMVPPPDPRRQTLLTKLFGRWRSSGGEPRESSSTVRPFRVLVAPFGNDPEDTQRPHVIAWIGALEGFTAKPHGKVLPLENDALLQPGERFRRADATARRWLGDDKADLVVWGEVDPEGRMIQVHFTSAPWADEDKAGQPHPLIWLPLPCYFDEGWAPLFQAAVMSAVEPRGEGQAQFLSLRLPGWMDAARTFIDTPVEGLYQIETALIFAVYGMAAAVTGGLNPGTGMQEYGGDVLRSAIEWTPAENADVWYALQRQLGLCYQAIAERTNSPDYFHAAAEAYRQAIYGTERSLEPVTWGSLHNRLGVVLFRLDMAEGNADALREAVGAFQYALTIFTRQGFPWHWSEVMHNVSQVLQVYGDAHRNQEVLERAIATSRNALLIRRQETVPHLWAASRNSLGAALFLLAKHARNGAPLIEAVQCFSDAVTTYRMLGARSLGKVAEKNLDRAQRLLDRLGGEAAINERRGG